METYQGGEKTHMAIVHEVDHIHEGSNNTGNGTNFLLGVILLAVVLFLLFYYGLPALRSGVGSTSPQVNVPGKIDVNVNGGQGSK